MVLASMVYSKQATIPAGTPISAPVRVDISFDPATVETITAIIPPGPSGLVGFQLWVKGGQALPTNQGAWIIGDDREITWQLASLPNSGAWQLVGYNTDIYDHTIYIEFQAASNAAALAPTDPEAANSTVSDILALGAS